MSFVFISYSRKDKIWKERLVSQLSVLEKHGYLKVWDDSKIGIGSDWKKEIESALNKTTLAVILVSKNFLASDFIMEDEISKLLEKKNQDKIRIVPIFIEPCMWTAVKWIQSLQGIPNDGRYLSQLSDHEIENELTIFSQQVIKFFNEYKKSRFPRASGFIKQQNLLSNQIRYEILIGFDKIASYARLTFGPNGHQIVFNPKSDQALFSNNFIDVISKIKLENNATDIPVKILRTFKDKLIEGGSKTTTILAHSIFREGMYWIENENVSYISIKRGIEKVKNDIFQELNSIKKPANDYSVLQKVISTEIQSYGEVSSLIIEAFKVNGVEHPILVENSQGISSEVTSKPGIRIDRGYLSPYFVTDSDRLIVEFDNPFILIYDGKISNMQDIVPILEKVVQSGNALLIIAENIESQALGVLVVNRLRAQLKIVAIKAPSFGGKRKSILEDIAILTGGTVISEEKGYKLENTNLEHLGKAEKILVNKNESIIVVESNPNINYDKKNLIGVISLGGVTEEIVLQKKDSILNSIEDAKRAYLTGVLPGGGITYLRLAKFLQEKKYDGIENICSQILIKAFEEPIKEILRNSDLDFEPIIKKLSIQDTWMGYNLLIEEYEDMYESGIVVPIKNVQSSIENSILIGIQLLSGHVVFGEEEKQNEVDNSISSNNKKSD